MIDWRDYKLAHLRHENTLRVSIQRRRVEYARTLSKRPVHNTILAWLGQQLIDWGQHLRTRYATMEACGEIRPSRNSVA